MPFSRYFYYQKGTPGDVEWKRKIKERLTPARDIGVYNAYAKEGWNDEVLVGAKESEPEAQVDALLRDAEVEGLTGEEGQEVKKQEIEKPMPRITEADQVGDTKSLDRKLQRTLYLVVREGKEGKWWFPNDMLVGKESLHTVRGCPLKFADQYCLLTVGNTGSRAYYHSGRRYEHEHLGCRQHSTWSLRPQLRSNNGKPRENGGVKRREILLHERKDHGWPGKPRGQQAWLDGLPVAGQG